MVFNAFQWVSMSFKSLWEPLGASGSLREPPGASGSFRELPGSLREPQGASGSLGEPRGAWAQGTSARRFEALAVGFRVFSFS